MGVCAYLLEEEEGKKEREKEKLATRGHLRVANHPIIWIKQVAPHWESSLKWRSILALRCLWKWKHISSLACSDFSNKAEDEKERLSLMLNNWMFGLEPVEIYLLFLLLNPWWTGWHDGVRCQALGFVTGPQHPICFEWFLFMQNLS